ncbi:hypothetical protein [Streptomyces sp. NBC_00078]|nr:hypothetical protein [Streptomyces sp. NBC_00078]MCX5426171.1 hypothetical protein [Streptomyces sp. NBC_00078]
MATTTSPGNDIALGLIAQDLMFLRRFMQGVATAQDEHAVVPMFCMHNYACLIVYESYRTLQAIEPALAELLAYDCVAAIAHARHSVKLFDDTRYKQLSDVGEDFERIIEVHREAFLNNTWLPLARPLEKDLALWRCRGRVISTSHIANFFHASSPQQIRNPAALGREFHDVAAELGRYAATVTDGLPWAGTSFMSSLKATDLTDRDVRAAKTYRQAFDPALPEEIKGALTSLTCALNVVDALLADDADGPSAATVLKLRYITLHHVLSSLRKLAAEYGPRLQPPARALLDQILTASTSDRIAQAHPQFRNTLVHYRPERRVEEQLSLNEPLYGLVGVYFPGEDFLSLNAEISAHLTGVAHRMQAWSGW